MQGFRPPSSRRQVRLCRDQSNAMLALSPKESTEAIAACGILLCVSTAETGTNFATRGGFFGCGALGRLCRLSAVLGLKLPEHGVVCRVFSLGMGLYLTSLFLLQNPCHAWEGYGRKRTMQQCRRILSVIFIQQCNTNTLAMLQSSFRDRPHPFRTYLLGDDFGDILFCFVHSSA